jgi:hypothetical protein
MLVSPLPSGNPHLLKPGNQHINAGGVSLVTVVEPHMFADGDQGREAFWRQRAEEPEHRKRLPEAVSTSASTESAHG